MGERKQAIIEEVGESSDHEGPEERLRKADSPPRQYAHDEVIGPSDPCWTGRSRPTRPMPTSPSCFRRRSQWKTLEVTTSTKKRTNTVPTPRKAAEAPKTRFLPISRLWTIWFEAAVGKEVRLGIDTEGMPRAGAVVEDYEGSVEVAHVQKPNNMNSASYNIPTEMGPVGGAQLPQIIQKKEAGQYTELYYANRPSNVVYGKEKSMVIQRIKG